MTNYKLVQGEPTEQQPEPISRNLRAVHAMILSALDRDAADGKAVRGEMAAELRSALSEQQPAPDVEGLVQQHHRDSAELRRLCQARDEQRDGRIAALERAAKALELAVKAEADVAGLVEALQNMLGAFDTPIIRRKVGSVFSEEAIGSAHAALAAHHKQGGEAGK